MQLARSGWKQNATTILYVASVVLFLVSIGHFHRKNTGFTYLIDFGDQFDPQKLPAVKAAPHYTHVNSPGYDGQFYAQLAVEPLLRDRRIDQALDSAPYRARRILFSWTAYVTGLGRPGWILKAYALQNILAWLLLAGLLLRWFPPANPRSFLPWFGCLFGVGLVASVRYALLEAPSLLLLALAILTVEQNRSWLGAALMGLSGLGRETNLLASGLLVNRLPRTREALQSTGGQLALAALPFVLWSLYLRSVYPRFQYSNPDSFAPSFEGYFTKWFITIVELRFSGWQSAAHDNLLTLVGLTTQAIFLFARREWASPWWRMGVMYCVLMPTLSVAVWDGYPGAALRLLLPMTFAFNVLVVQSRWYWPLAILGNLSVVQGLHLVDVKVLAPYL